MLMTKKLTLNDIPIGSTATVIGFNRPGTQKRRLIDMGITPGVLIAVRRAAPLGDPLEIQFRGYELSIRRAEAQEILVLPASKH